MSKLTITGPSYVMGYWRPWKENSKVFDSFLDYSKDLGLANYTASAVGTYIQEAASQQIDAINNLAYEIGYGMNVLSSQLEDVSGELRFLNRNMDIQIEQQKLSNLLLLNIAELLRVPDSEKERQLAIEMGVKFLVNAAKNPDLYDDALEELHKAEELRKQDYFVLHRLGTIYLYAEKHMNPERALEYFLLAAKYASVESDPKAMRLANVMTQSFDTVNSVDSTESIQHLAGDSYEKAAFACYVLGSFEEAEKNQQKALKLHPTPENKFLLAKYAVRNGNIDDGVKHLSEAIDESPELMGGVFKELDLANEKAVIEMGKRKNSVANSEIEEIIQGINKKTKKNKSALTDSLHKLKNSKYSFKIKTIDELKWYLNELIHPPKTQLNNVNVSEDLANSSYTNLLDSPYQYLHVQVGESIWMAENLSIDRFRNGTVIKQAQTNKEWKEAGDNESPAWCWVLDNPKGKKRYGKLYNWYAVNDSRGLAPAGWLIPSEDDFNKLIKYKSNVESYCTIEINLPASGARDQEKCDFIGVGISGYYWSRTHSDEIIKVFDFIAPHNEAGVSSGKTGKLLNNGFSVRCIKEKGPEIIKKEKKILKKKLDQERIEFEQELEKIANDNLSRDAEKKKNELMKIIDPLSEQGFKNWISFAIIIFLILYFSGCLE